MCQIGTICGHAAGINKASTILIVNSQDKTPHQPSLSVTIWNNVCGNMRSSPTTGAELEQFVAPAWLNDSALTQFFLAKIGEIFGHIHEGGDCTKIYKTAKKWNSTVGDRASTGVKLEQFAAPDPFLGQNRRDIKHQTYTCEAGYFTNLCKMFSPLFSSKS